MVDGRSLLLDLDGVVVESVQRLADGTRLVQVSTAAESGRNFPRVRGTLHPIEGLGVHWPARYSGRP